MANKSLHQARVAKNDEFYTRLEDIADELRHYRHHFRDKMGSAYILVFLYNELVSPNSHIGNPAAHCRLG